MNKFRFLHCADLHFDKPFSYLKNNRTDRSDIKRQDIRDVFNKIINIAKNEEIDAILICGDLYEHNYVKKSTIDFINSKLSEINHIKVFIIAGNHDPYLSNSYYKNYRWNENVTIFNDSLMNFYLEDKNVNIYGLGFMNFIEERSLIENTDFSNINKTAINILMTHGTLDLTIKQNLYNPLSSKDLMSIGLDYVALGHFHNRKHMTCPNCQIINPGSPEPLGFDGSDEHGVFLVQIEILPSLERLFDIKYINTNKRSYVSLEVDISKCKTHEKLIQELVKRILSIDNISDNPDGFFLLINLKGSRERNLLIDVDTLYSTVKGYCFYAKIIDLSVEKIDFNEYTNALGLKGIFARKIQEKFNSAFNENEKNILIRAFNYGIEALEQGKLDI